VHQHKVAGRRQAKMALTACVLAKNSVVRRHGYTPEQAVFGRALRWPSPIALNDDDEIPWSALTPSAEQARANRMRETARYALCRLDAKDKVCRAVLRKPPPRLESVLPGTRVYFHVPHPLKGRSRADPVRWRGPATVMASRGEGRYFLAWRGRVVLVAREQLRLATAEERAAQDKVAEDARLTAQDLREDGGRTDFHDMTSEVPPEQPQESHPPPEPELPALPPGVEPEAPAESPRPPSQDLEAQRALLDALARAVSHKPEATPAREEYSALDDVPISIRRRLADAEDSPRKRRRYQDLPVAADQLPALTMLACAGGAAAWFSKEECRALSSVLCVDVYAVQVCAEPRGAPPKNGTPG